MLKKYVLVVEDNDSLRDMMVEMLELEGYEAFQAENGHKALTLVTNVKFDLITLDIAMPEMDGNQFLTRLATISPVTPVIVVSAWDNALQATPQVKAVLDKPFDLKTFTTIAKSYLYPALGLTPSSPLTDFAA